MDTFRALPVLQKLFKAWFFFDPPNKLKDIMNSKEPENSEKHAESISELARRHMMDRTHTTTDEEIRNARVVLTGNVKPDKENLFEVDNTTIIPPMPVENDKNLQNEDNNKNDQRGFPNPYDILDG
jgi:hypothetical protein